MFLVVLKRTSVASLARGSGEVLGRVDDVRCSRVEEELRRRE